jgi:N-acyl-D-amino-acid deacylase
MHDLVIRNASIVDGTGAAARRGDVAVDGGRIVEVGAVSEAGRRELDADGLCLSPGFIDMHSHSDHYLLVNPTAEGKIAQGITTEVCGNCGFSSAPLVHPDERAETLGYLAKHGIEADWTSVAGYFDTLESHGIGLNFMTLIGHGTLRAAVVGYDDRAATPAELDQMKALSAQCMDEGALGIASGLIYAPGCYGNTDEVAEVCKPVGERGGVYATHMRSEGDELIEAVEETIGIGEKSGAKVQISHHKACGPANWGKVNLSLPIIEAARARGVDVTADQYPYIATCTSLSVNVPQWAHDGGDDRFVARLQDPALIPRLKSETIAHVEGGYSDPMQGWRDVVVAAVKSDANRWAEGMSVAAIADRWNISSVDALFRLLVEEHAKVAMVHFTLSEEDVETVMRQPYVMIGSDATARALSGPTRVGKPHPRTFGTMPRVLGRYVREKRVLTLEEAIRKMTSLAAWRLGLSDRGRIAPGMMADITLFDPETVTDTATFEDPFHLPEGIPHVFTNGVAVVDEGRITGNLPGKCLRFAAAG